MFFWFPVKGKKVCHRFIEKSDCYLDQETGLEWSKDNYGPYTWDQLMSFDKGSIWRVPTIKELLTLVDYEKYGPAASLPEIELSNYWSSTPYADDTNYAWYTYFYDGYSYVSRKSNSHYVRAVRDERRTR